MNTSEQIKEFVLALLRAKGPIEISDPVHLFYTDRRQAWRRDSTLVGAFFSRIAWVLPSDCWYWIGSRNHVGYGMLATARRFDCPEIFAHRIAWHLMNGPVPSDNKVLHRCDVRLCVNPEHLFLGTQLDNMRDCRDKGRLISTSLPGELNPMHRLTADQVRQIRELKASGMPQIALSRQFNVSPMAISRAVRRETWRAQ